MTNSDFTLIVTTSVLVQGYYQRFLRSVLCDFLEMVNRDMVVSKETLLSRVWGNDAEAVENNVEIYISFLRKKLDFLKADVMISKSPISSAMISAPALASPAAIPLPMPVAQPVITALLPARENNESI